MCIKDLLKYKRLSFTNAAGTLVAGAGGLILKRNARRLRLLITVQYPTSVALGTQTVVNLLTNATGIGQIACTVGTPNVIMTVEEYGTLITGEVVLSNLGTVTAAYSVTEIYNDEPIEEM